MPGPYLQGMADHVFGVFRETERSEYIPVSGDPSFSVEVVFVAFFQMVDNFGVPFGSPNPTAWIKVNDVPDPQNGDVIVIQGVNYTIREVLPDGHEINKLTLSR